MTPPRTLVLTQLYPPEPAQLLADLATALRARRHDVHVLTGFPNYPAGRAYPGYTRRLWMRDELDGIPITRVPCTFNHRLSLVPRLTKYGSFVASAATLGPWLVRRPDVIYVYGSPMTVGLAADVLRRWWRVPMVLHIQDLWPETLEALGAVRSPRAVAAMARMSSYLYRRSDAIVVVSPGFQRSLLARGVPAEKIHLILELGGHRTLPARAEERGARRRTRHRRHLQRDVRRGDGARAGSRHRD